MVKKMIEVCLNGEKNENPFTNGEKTGMIRSV